MQGCILYPCFYYFVVKNFLGSLYDDFCYIFRLVSILYSRVILLVKIPFFHSEFCSILTIVNLNESQIATNFFRDFIYVDIFYYIGWNLHEQVCLGCFAYIYIIT